MPAGKVPDKQSLAPVAHDDCRAPPRQQARRDQLQPAQRQARRHQQVPLMKAALFARVHDRDLATRPVSAAQSQR